MSAEAKSEQLQIRVSPQMKKKLQLAAKKSGVGMSEWILGQLFPLSQNQFHDLVAELYRIETKSFVFAELNDFLARLSGDEFEHATRLVPPSLIKLAVFEQNYLAAMIEFAAHQKKCAMPKWLQFIAPLCTPYWGTELKNLRIHLLLNSPIPFRKRNIFIDSSVGERV